MIGPLFHMITEDTRPVASSSHAAEDEGWVVLTGQMPTKAAAPDAPLPTCTATGVIALAVDALVGIVMVAKHP